MTMVSRRKQIIELTILELTKRAHSDEGAAKALDRYYEIENAGGRPEIRHSEFNGYRVIDQNS